MPNLTLVIGAAQGIGLATAELFQTRGGRVVRASRRLPLGPESAPCDVRSEYDVRTLFAYITSKYGVPATVVNAAGILGSDQQVDDWENVLRTNLIGSWLVCKVALEYMTSGSIILIGSVAAHHHSATANLAYTCSKYGVVGLTRSLAQTSPPIRINCVMPSQTRTPMLVENTTAARCRELEVANPLGRLAEPDEVARVVYWLASDDASYVNGAIIDVNGGMW